METLYYEEEIFEVLYNLSVGLERLLKIVVILIEHDDTVDQEEFERSLLTHSHLDLLKRIKGHRKVTLAGPHNELLQLLSVFYKTYRYGRYGTAAMKARGEEKAALHAFISKHLKIEIMDEPPVMVTPNSRRIKKFVGRQVGKISQELYRLIEAEARRLNIYTYELRCTSKAAKIFLRNEYDFDNEELLWRELIVFFANCRENRGMIGYIRKQVPLEFDPGLAEDYLQSFSNQEKRLEVLDELEELYRDVEDPAARLASIGLIGESGILFDDDIEKDEE